MYQSENKLHLTDEFFKSIESNTLLKVKELLGQDPTLIHQKHVHHRTPILVAAMHQHYELVEYFIEAKADINAQDHMSLNPFLWAVLNNDLRLVKMMIQTHQVDLHRLTRFGGNAVIPAAEKGHIEILEYLLKNTDINPNLTNTLGWTALIEAIILNDGDLRQQQIVKLLLTHGADPNMVDAYGKTPLTLAKEKGYFAIAEILLDHGGI